MTTESGGYRFDLGRADVDVDEFDALLREAAASPAEVRKARLEEALTLVLGRRACGRAVRDVGG